MLKKVTLLCALSVMLAGAAHADAVVGGAGFRGGFSIDPDQAVLGGQLIIGELAPNLTFDPNLEIGFGDDISVIAANLDLHYHFAISGERWRPYAGGGIGINFISIDLGPGFGDVSDTEVGLNLVGGVGVPTESNNRFFGELRLGIGDIPELKIMAGMNFKI